MADNHAKTALFLCKCGTNLSSCVDLDALEQWARTRDDVDVVACHNLLCSPDGAKFFKDTLAEHNPGHVVVAACSPKMHEKTFRGLAEEAGVNMGCVHMANIREQCGWVTPDMIQATEKADRLIAAALHRVQLSGHLARQTMACVCDVLVVGGGIAGIEAALMAARAGKHVYIVERDIALGGEVAKTEEIAPKMECGPCLLAPRLAEVRDNPNITVFSNAEIVEAKGFYGNFTVTVKKRARYVEDSCIGCEACFEVCPVEAPNAFHLGLGNRKAIHTLFIGAVPAAASIDADRCLHFTDGSCEACVEACPFGAVNFAQQDETIEVHVGAVIVATGAMPNNPGAIESLGYGTIENVYTLPEFERLASSNGPTGGAVQLRNGTKPASVAVIHCAGSLQDGGLAYCSSTCCLGAMKVGELLRHQVPDAAVVNVHGDIVMTGPAEHAFLRKQREAGTRFVACRDLTSVRLTQNGDQIRVSGGGFDPFDADMVVLATGKRPASGTQALADL
ncbi:MAG: heterodisulfide reductase subunit, partial [Candidatus Hydrogenedentes bacterium]|nr:heterodisulfide reductase subunit [Candidatus Hydrogenedentota bacterium]